MTILNRKRLHHKLGLIPKAVRDQISEAIAKSARQMVDTMETLVPEDSGELKGSIGWTWGDAPKGAMTFGQSRSGSLIATIYAGDDGAFYARWVEFGTTEATARPFFYPAYRANRKRAKSAISRATIKAVKKIANG